MDPFVSQLWDDIHLMIDIAAPYYLAHTLHGPDMQNYQIINKSYVHK